MKIVHGMGAAALLLLTTLPAMPEQRQKLLSSTKTFLIDGQRFRVEKSADSDIDLIRRQLAHRGWNLPAPVTRESGSANPIYSASLRMEGDAAPPSLVIPEGLHAEHILRMESESGPIDLVEGSMDAIPRPIHNRMREYGWTFIDAGHDRDPLSLAILNKGRETFLVLLDEKERKFLLVHRME